MLDISLALRALRARIASDWSFGCWNDRNNINYGSAATVRRPWVPARWLILKRPTCAAKTLQGECSVMLNCTTPETFLRGFLFYIEPSMPVLAARSSTGNGHGPFNPDQLTTRVPQQHRKRCRWKVAQWKSNGFVNRRLRVR